MIALIILLLIIADPLVDTQVDRWDAWAGILGRAYDATGDERVPGLAKAWYRAQDKRLFWRCVRTAIQLPLGRDNWQAIKNSWEFREGAYWKSK